MYSVKHHPYQKTKRDKNSRYSFRMGRGRGLLIQDWIIRLEHNSMNKYATSIVRSLNVDKHISNLHLKNVVVSIDKHPTSITFVCNSQFINCVKTFTWKLNTLTSLTKEEILNSHNIFWVTLESQPNIFIHSIEYLNDIKVRKTMLLCSLTLLWWMMILHNA